MILTERKGLLNRIKRAFLPKYVKEEIYRLNNNTGRKTKLSIFDLTVIHGYFGYCIDVLKNEEGTQGKIPDSESEKEIFAILDKIAKKPETRL